MKQSQEQLIYEQLIQSGSVSRNWALQRHITRLGAIIAKLKKEKRLKVEACYIKTDFGQDYIYRLRNKEVYQIKKREDFLQFEEQFKKIRPHWDAWDRYEVMKNLFEKSKAELEKKHPQRYIINNFINNLIQYQKKYGQTN